MKKLSIVLGAAVAMLSLVSCNKEIANINDDNAPKSKAFDLVANIASTKTTLDATTYEVAWEEDDVVYAVTTDGEWGLPYNSDKDGETIAEYTYSAGKFTTEAEISAGSHTFNFLYTAGKQKSYHRGAGSTFQIYNDPSMDCLNPTAHIKKSDALAGQVTLTTPAEFAEIEMNHIFALMQVNVKNSTGNDVTITKFEMTVDENSEIYGVFDVDFSDGSVSYNKNGGNSIGLTVTNGTVAAGEKLPLNFVMAPLTNYSGDITFVVTDSEGNTYTKTITATGLTFAAGTYNTTPYTIKDADEKPDADLVYGSYAYTFTESQYSAAGTATLGALSWTLATDGGYFGYDATKGQQVGSGSKPASSITLTSSNYGDAVEKVIVNTSGAKDINATVSVSVNGFEYVCGDKTAPSITATATEYVFVPSGEAQTGDVVISWVNSSSKAVYFKSIEINPEEVAPTLYNITVSPTTNGTVTASKSQAEEGETITLTVEPADGYELATLTYNDIDIKAAKSFTMPAANVTVSATFKETSTGGTAKYVKVTSASSLTDGTYLIVCEDQNVAFDGGLSTLDAVSNTINVTITNGEIAKNATVDAATFTFTASTGSFKSKSGKYIGNASDSNALNTSTSELTNTVTISGGDASIKAAGGSYLRYNATSGQTRFRYYKSSTYTGQKAIQLYKLTN